jgi:Mg2+ and Co2+ transporter CorA
MIRDFESKAKERDYYLICLHDHQILEALRKDRNLQLLPLLIYVFVHELVHIVRFCNFSQRFEVSDERREKEEKVVHSTTFDILKGLSLPRMDYVLHSYQNHRICEMTMS